MGRRGFLLSEFVHPATACVVEKIAIAKIFASDSNGFVVSAKTLKCFICNFFRFAG